MSIHSKNNKSNSEFQDNLFSYTNNFVQRTPRYAVKFPGGRWNTKNKPLSDRPIISHLNNKYYVGTLSQWYPHFVIIDIDNVPLHTVDRMRELLNLNPNNSMLCSSESPNCFHILLKPLYNNKPPTVKLLQAIFRIFASIHHIEIFPQSNKVIRLPFCSSQSFIDEEYHLLNSSHWSEKLYRFNKLPDYDLNSVAHHQLSIPLDYITPKSDKILTTLQEGRILYEHGLQMPSSRHDSQFNVLYFLFRSNTPQDVAVDMTFDWLRKKHNGFSKDYPGRSQLCKQEIIRQADCIYTKYDLTDYLPDSTHNLFNGFISKSDLISIVNICSGSVPRMKFLFNLFRYVNPRRYRTFINVHSDKLISWSSRMTYIKYLNEFEEKGILKRGTSYMHDLYSKSIIPNWNFSSPADAILYDGRSPNLLNNAIKLALSSYEFKQLLTNHSKDRSNIWGLIQDIYIDRSII